MKAFGSSLGPLYTLWERLQVSHCGQYSVERMLALEEYGQRVSPIRVAAVCVLTPLPALVLVVLAGYMPLRPVAEGPDANYVFWMRHILILGFAVLSGLLQAKAWLAELHLTLRTISCIALGVAVVTTVIGFVVAKFWAFPVPFMNVVQVPGLVLIATVAARIVLGGNALQNMPDAEFRVNRFFLLLVAQGSLATIYPAYHALFLLVPSSVQPYLIALLTLVNIAMKNALAACGAHLEDRLPEVIVFSVDVFNSLYSALCMRSTNSMKMVAIAVTLNTLDMMLALHGMNRRSRVALANRAVQQNLQRQQKQSAKTLGSKTPEKAPDSLGSLFQATLQLLQMPGQLDPAELRQICLLSCAEHKVSEANKALLQALAARCVYNNERRPTEIRSMAQRKSRYSSTAVSGPDLSFEHSAVALTPPSRLMQRLRAAVWMIPEAGQRFSFQIGTRLGNSLGFRMDSKARLSQRVDTEGGDQSDTDNFENDTTSNEVAALTAPPSRRASAQTLIEPILRRISAAQVEPFSRRTSMQGGSGRRISTQMGPGSSRRVSAQMGGGSSRKVSALAPESTGSYRTVAPQHSVSSRRLVELVAASTKLATSLKLRQLLMPGKLLITDVLKETRKQNTVAVNQTLQLLFNNEYLGLIAYAQCITPMIYMGYMIIMQEMPNRVFYLSGEDLIHPEAQRFTVIAAFVGLQTGILVGLHLFVATRFGVSTLYQVAFVLETHARLVQGKIATWLLFAVSFMLEHYGADFSFKFEWAKNHPP
ncbi:hypothetical protein PR003_g22460 [Phytophthora rubi]|uniref:Uncharacterized protein n=1 Tax=Phytophthora rubi TaxID=129364 RepID=A0A6A3M0U2_9STRA|nr:hypothetical protein PR001_g16313 [Phytophthora rubi]KAE9022084.1 hypothetical protein PR002_g12074 [Phytophthora rubi]KAE9301670.1 hypothetical protein PR003_g22460 [Phytophthora rubi]